MRAIEQEWQTVLRQSRPMSRSHMITICRNVAEERAAYRWWRNHAEWCDRHDFAELGDNAMIEALKALRAVRKWRSDRRIWWNWLKELSHV